jgi:hypothetical protein
MIELGGSARGIAKGAGLDRSTVERVRDWAGAQAEAVASTN